MSLIEALAKRHWYAWKDREHPGMLKALEDLRREPALSPAAWHHRLEDRLASLLQEAREHVPYYTDLFAERGLDVKGGNPLEELHKLPVLTKSQVREAGSQLLNKRLSRSELLSNSTGGSTGVPLTFYQTQRYEALSVALDAYVRESWGVTPWAKTAFIWGADRDLPEWSWRDRLYHWRSRYRMINAFRMTERDLAGFLNMLRRWRPPYLVGYAGALNVLAAFAEEQGVGDLRFEAVRSSAEMLWPDQRARLERVFQSPVYNFYGSREVNNLAAECPGGRKLHLISSWRVVEVVDANGDPVAPGRPGHLCVTDLGNSGMPFIRYLNGDLGVLDPDPCSCGRPTPVLRKLIGRSSDVITAADGTYVHGEFFTHLFYGRDDVRRFQVHQTTLNHLDLFLEPGSGGPPPEEFFQTLQDKIRVRMGDAVEVRVEMVESIPASPTGKHRFTISDITPDLLQ